MDFPVGARISFGTDDEGRVADIELVAAYTFRSAVDDGGIPFLPGPSWLLRPKRVPFRKGVPACGGHGARFPVPRQAGEAHFGREASCAP